MKTHAFVLRKMAGTFDACVAGVGMVRAPFARATVGAASAFGSLSAALILPLLLAVILAAFVAAVTHATPLAVFHLASAAPHATHLALAGAAMGSVDLVKVHDDLQAATKQMREVNEQALAEVKKYGAETSETKATLGKIQKEMDALEIKMQRALTAGTKTDEMETKRSELEEREIKAFAQLIRTGEKTEYEKIVAERKSLSTDSDPDGGYAAMPITLANRIINKLIQFSNIRALATVETITTGRGLAIPAEGSQNFEAGWVGQRASRGETNAGQVRMEEIPAHEMYAKPLISQTQLDDQAFDLESWAGDRVARRLAVIEGQSFVNGSGAGQPEGYMTNADVQVVNSGDANKITTDGMFDLMAALPTPYALNATIVGNRKSKYALRKLKDSQGRYLWEPSLQAGMPAAFDSTPFVEIVDMPDVAANAYPVAYGDFKAAYTIVDRQGIRMIRDIYSSKPFVELYTTKRTGGQVVLAEALRKLKISA